MHGFSPQICSNLLWLQHTGGHLLERPIFPLRYSVLLGSVRNLMLDMNTTLGEYVKKIITDILPSIIRYQYLDLNPRGIFDQGLQFRKIFTYFRLLFEKEDPCVPWKIINKSHKIPWSIHRCDRNWTADIRMYQPQYACSLVCLPSIELVLRVFSNHTALANSCGFLQPWIFSVIDAKIWN